MGQMTLATPPARVERRASEMAVPDRPVSGDRPVVVWCGWGEKGSWERSQKRSARRMVCKRPVQ